MIVTLHVATGAVAGAAARSRLAALLLGPPLHLLGDVLPHEDIASRRFETASGVAAVLALAAANRSDLQAEPNMCTPHAPSVRCASSITTRIPERGEPVARVLGCGDVTA